MLTRSLGLEYTYDLIPIWIFILLFGSTYYQGYAIYTDTSTSILAMQAFQAHSHVNFNAAAKIVLLVKALQWTLSNLKLGMKLGLITLLCLTHVCNYALLH